MGASKGLVAPALVKSEGRKGGQACLLQPYILSENSRHGDAGLESLEVVKSRRCFGLEEGKDQKVTTHSLLSVTAPRSCIHIEVSDKIRWIAERQKHQGRLCGERTGFWV